MFDTILGVHGSAGKFHDLFWCHRVTSGMSEVEMIWMFFQPSRIVQSNPIENFDFRKQSPSKGFST